MENKSHAVLNQLEKCALVLPIDAKNLLDVACGITSGYLCEKPDCARAAYRVKRLRINTQRHINSDRADAANALTESHSKCSKTKKSTQKNENPSNQSPVKGKVKVQHLKSRVSYLRQVLRKKQQTIKALRSQVQSTIARLNRQQNAHREYRIGFLLQLHQINQMAIQYQHPSDNDKNPHPVTC